MTYGQDKHGVPKGLTEDAGFLGNPPSSLMYILTSCCSCTDYTRMLLPDVTAGVGALLLTMKVPSIDCTALLQDTRTGCHLPGRSRLLPSEAERAGDDPRHVDSKDCRSLQQSLCRWPVLFQSDIGVCCTLPHSYPTAIGCWRRP